MPKGFVKVFTEANTKIIPASAILSASDDSSSKRVKVEKIENRSGSCAGKVY